VRLIFYGETWMPGTRKAPSASFDAGYIQRPGGFADILRCRNPERAPISGKTHHSLIVDGSPHFFNRHFLSALAENWNELTATTLVVRDLLEHRTICTKLNDDSDICSATRCSAGLDLFSPLICASTESAAMRRRFALLLPQTNGEMRWKWLRNCDAR